MIIELPRRVEHFGAVRFHDLQRVYELDSGSKKFATKSREAVATISNEEISEVNRRMAIVVPVKDEKLRLFESVLSGIPHDCHVIVVSGSRRNPVDRFAMEVRMLRHFNHFVGDEITVVHQSDPGLAEALMEAGYTSILGDDGLVRRGKGEAMVIGVLLAKMLGKEYVGFVDADNYVPGSVHEYVEIYAAGFNMAENPYSMVRVSWVYKPKVKDDGLFFAKMGRVSAVINACLNAVMSFYSGFETEVVKTANSGEHAMSMKLAELLFYASGFAAETYELVNLMEELGGVAPPSTSSTLQAVADGVDVFQVESRNPHLHEEKGEEHIKEMLLSSLGAVYHSHLCTGSLKEALLSICARHSFNVDAGEIPVPSKVRPPREADISKLADKLRAKAETLVELR